MTDKLTELIVASATGIVMLILAIVIRVRGPRGLVHGVDWERVSDVQGLGQFVSMMVSVLAALIVAHGIALYAFFQDDSKRNIATVVFVVCICLIVFALLIGKLRYQDKPAARKTDGRR